MCGHREWKNTHVAKRGLQRITVSLHTLVFESRPRSTGVSVIGASVLVLDYRHFYAGSALAWVLVEDSKVSANSRLPTAVQHAFTQCCSTACARLIARAACLDGC